MCPSFRKQRFRTNERALQRRNERPFSTRRFQHLKGVVRSAENDLLQALARLAFNPEGHVDVQLPCGGWARVSPDASPDLIAALDRMMRAAAEQYGFELPTSPADPFAATFAESPPETKAAHMCDEEGCTHAGNACFLPDSDAPFGYYCFTHAHPNGFCGGCGHFWGGNERFDFGNGLCDNCKDSL